MGKKDSQSTARRDDEGRARRRKVDAGLEARETLRRSQSEAPRGSEAPTPIFRTSSDASPRREASERPGKSPRSKKSIGSSSSALPSLSGMFKPSSPSKKRNKAAKGSSKSELKKVRSGAARKNKEAGSTPRKGSLGSAIEPLEAQEPTARKRPVSSVQLVTDAVSKEEVASGVEAERERSAMMALQPALAKLQRGKPGLRASFRRQDSVGQDYLLDLEPRRRLTGSKLVLPTAAVRSLSGDAMDDMKALKIERKRMRVMNEMLSTETTYFEALQTVITLFIAPLKKTMTTNAPLLTEAEFNLAFQNIEDIRVVNGELLKHLSKRKQSPEQMIWCDLLVTWLSNPEVTESYQRYINGYEHARKFLSQAMKNSELLSALSPKERERVVKEGGVAKEGKYAHALLGDFIRKRLSHALCGGFGSITSFLITPVQRLPRYLLFLRELDELTPATHPDREHVDRSYELLKSVTGKIDERKNVYDAIYHKEALLMSFPPSDQRLLQDITHADRHLLAEGPLVEGEHVHYVLVFIDLIVCACKSEDGLRLLWRACTYTDQIEVRASEDGEYLYVVEVARFSEYPFIAKTHHVLYPFEEGVFNVDFWRPHFQTLIDGKKSQTHCATLAAELTNRLAPVLMPTEAWDELSLGMKTRAITAGKTVLKQGTDADIVVMVQEGEVELNFCLEASLMGGTADTVQVLGNLEPRQFFAEQHLLERRPGKLAFGARSVGFTKFTEISIKALHQRMAENGAVAAGLYHLVALITGSRFLRALADEARPYAGLLPVLAGKYGEETDMHTQKVIRLTSIPAKEACAHGCYPCYLTHKKKKQNMLQLVVTSQFLCLLGEKKCIHQTRGATVAVSSFNAEARTVSLHIPKTRTPVDLCFPDHSTFTAALRSLDALIMRCSGRLPYSFEPRETVDLEDEEWDTLLAKAKEQSFGKGDVILSAGCFNEKIYQVLEGNCTATHRTCQGEEQVRIRAGEIFGEVSFLFGLAATASVVACGSVLVRTISHADLALALHENPQLAGGFFKLLGCVTKRRLEKVHTTRLRNQAIGSSTSESDSLK